MLLKTEAIGIGLIACLIGGLPSCKCVTCDDSPPRECVVCGDPAPPETFIFANNKLQMWADRQHVAIDSSFEIEQLCRPLYTGKGSFYLHLLGGGRTVFVDTPLQDTLSTRDGQLSMYPVLFRANETFQQSWTVRLHGPGNTSYGFEGFVRMDSILINGRYYAVSSATADSLALSGPFRAWAVTFEVLTIETP